METKIDYTCIFARCKERFSAFSVAIALFIAEYIRAIRMLPHLNQSPSNRLIHRHRPFLAILGVVEVDDAPPEIDIIPFNPQYLALTHPRVQCHYRYRP
ncbi:MAG: hypothetical protein Q8N14_06160 [Candidatus Omnitrophota bacterium]|nr:hypothetical protein [Candidatus Omnitrophota bacterium]